MRILQSQLDRVECYDDLTVAVDEVLAAGEPMMALVNVPVEETQLRRLLDAQSVIVIRNLNRAESMKALFDAASRYMPAGQTYTNNKIAILNPNPKLQREDFQLWL